MGPDENESETANGGAEALSEFDSLVGETCERLLSLSLSGVGIKRTLRSKSKSVVPQAVSQKNHGKCLRVLFVNEAKLLTYRACK